jgi:hypothetical protein
MIAVIWFVFPIVDLRLATGLGDRLLSRPEWRRSPGVRDFLRHFGPVGFRAAEKLRGARPAIAFQSSEEKFARAGRFALAPRGRIAAEGGEASVVRIASRVYSDGYLAGRLELSSEVSSRRISRERTRTDVIEKLLESNLRIGLPVPSLRRRRETVPLYQMGRCFADVFNTATMRRTKH